MASNPSLFLLLSDSQRFHRINLGRWGDMVEVSNPFGRQQIKLLGSCNGFLCISNADHSKVAIWNPTTHMQKLLPRTGTQIRGGLFPCACVHGFGYDHRNNYVLLRVVQSLEEPIEYEVSIYNLRNNAWRRLEEIEMPYYLDSTRKRGVFLHGRPHWIMRREWAQDSTKVLVAFDFHANRFVEVDQLKNNMDNRLDMDLAVQGGHLYVITYGEQRVVQVWRMGEYALNGPWRRWLSIPDHPSASGLVWPLDYSPHGGRQVLVAVGTERLCWYDSETGEYITDFDNNAMPSFTDAVVRPVD